MPVDPPTVARPETGAEPADGNDGRRLGLGILIGSVVLSLLLCGSYLALGGLDYKPSPVADPCKERPWGDPQGMDQVVERVSLVAADGAACKLGVSREELIRSLTDESSRSRFAAKHDFTEEQIGEALRSGLSQAVDRAKQEGSISSLVAMGLQVAIRSMPLETLVAALTNAPSLLDGGLLNSDLLGGGSLGGLGDMLDGALDFFGGGSSDGQGSRGDSPGDALKKKLKEGIDGLLGQ